MQPRTDLDGQLGPAPPRAHSQPAPRPPGPTLLREGPAAPSVPPEWMHPPEPACGDLRSERGTQADTQERPPAAQHASVHKAEASPAAWSDRS